MLSNTPQPIGLLSVLSTERNSNELQNTQRGELFTQVIIEYKNRLEHANNNLERVKIAVKLETTNQNDF